MNDGIFSTYSQGENRITSTIVQVLKNLPISHVEKFLGMFVQDENRAYFRFNNQPKGEKSTPDARILANFDLLFETKTKKHAVNEPQLKKHFQQATKGNAKLIYLTPDDERPKILCGNEFEAISWVSFENLHQLIMELIRDPDIIVSERDQFLLRNLQLLIEDAGLLPTKDLTVIVAAKKAWGDYQKIWTVCLPTRSELSAL